jgi:hypothetical protein
MHKNEELMSADENRSLPEFDSDASLGDFWDAALPFQFIFCQELPSRR